MSSESSSILSIPFLMPSQAQKHVTHNEAIIALDAIVQLSVKSMVLNDPPLSPLDGDRYIVGASPTSDWAGKANAIAVWADLAWAFFTPNIGWIAWVEDEEALFAWRDGAWSVAVNTNITSAETFGVNATADAFNRLSLNSSASLFNHDGTDHRLVINKADTVDTASVVLQNGFSGRAEIGLTGGDDFAFKTSADGSSWVDAIKLDAATGIANFKAVRSGEITIDDDAIGQITTPNAGGIVVIVLTDSLYPQVNHTGIFAYDTGPSLSLLHLSMGTGMANRGALVLTGTDGFDDKTNIAVESDKLVIENRYGSTQTYSYTFIG